MCMICKDWEMDKITIAESYRNLKEVFDEENKHHVELWARLFEAELNKEDKLNEID